jgi:hypothetical protein
VKVQQEAQQLFDVVCQVFVLGQILFDRGHCFDHIAELLDETTSNITAQA